MKKKRVFRIAEEIKRAISELLQTEIKDPRIKPMTSITKVEVTNDLSFAYIYISVLGNEEDKQDTIEGLNNAKGFIKREIGKRIDLRHVPETIFYIDKSIEQSIYMSKLIEKVQKEDEKRQGENNE